MEDSNKNGFDPFDPFSEKEEVFETKNIRASKAGRLTSKKSASAPVKKKKKLPLGKRLKFAFKSFSEREDKKRIFLFFGISLCLIAGIIIVYFSFIESWRKEQIDIAETDKAIVVNNEVYDFLKHNSQDQIKNTEEKKEKEEELKKLVDESINNPEAQYQYACALFEIYKTTGDIASVELISEKVLNNKNLTFPTNAYFLIALKGTYFYLGDNDKYRETMEKILALPDDDQYSFNAATFTEEKKAVMAELKRLDDEEGIEE